MGVFGISKELEIRVCNHVGACPGLHPIQGKENCFTDGKGCWEGIGNKREHGFPVGLCQETSLLVGLRYLVGCESFRFWSPSFIPLRFLF